MSIWAALMAVSPAYSGALVFHDRPSFMLALAGQSLATDDFEGYAAGNIAAGTRRGDFVYEFDANSVQAAVASDGTGGQALGGAPEDVFVGGDSVRLWFQPPLAAARLRAFGAEFIYAPSFAPIDALSYGILLEDGPHAGLVAGNEAGLDPGGGSFFLGLIEDAGSSFSSLSLFSVQTDPQILLPAYQVDSLVYASIPEPASLATVLLTLLCAWLCRTCRRNRHNAAS
ncbi:hypothetical protein [Paucibacter soli]|uniref:hypothetical protein n=1 Tax=Paucibacter soli TaxID=3133433 RepID=UPI0030A6EDC9